MNPEHKSVIEMTKTLPELYAQVTVATIYREVLHDVTYGYAVDGEEILKFIKKMCEAHR